ncbi:MAG: nitroreductase family protein [Desulfurococcaceae archaeon]|jgi:nitroreductase
MSRCSVRWFKQDPVPREVLLRVLEAGIRAPTAGGGEQWFFVVVESEEKRREVHRLLKKAHELYARHVVSPPLPEHVVLKWVSRIEQGMYYAPVYVAAYLDLRKRMYGEEYREYEKLMAIQSLSAALENMVLAAWSMGLGSVWLGVPLLLRDEFDKLLEPPPGCELQAVLALGYPAEEPRPRKRKPLSEVYKVV